MIKDERRKYRRVFSHVHEEDVVLFSVSGRSQFRGKLTDFSRGGALIYAPDPGAAAEIGRSYNLYFQSRGQMFHLEGVLVRRDMEFCAFEFVNVTPFDIAEIRGKLARMEIMAARSGVSSN